MKNCSFSGCGRKHHAHGYCVTHGKQVKEGRTEKHRIDGLLGDYPPKTLPAGDSTK